MVANECLEDSSNYAHLGCLSSAPNAQVVVKSRSG
nr:MAG TPA: hypothetical protein [Caudoviricetes sp.]